MSKYDRHAEEHETYTAQAVAVDIYDQVYHLSGSDVAHIEQLAVLVDTKMRTVAAHGGTVDSLRAAVLASLNIADELMMLRRRYEDLASMFLAFESSTRTRSASLGELLDEVLDTEYCSPAGHSG